VTERKLLDFLSTVVLRRGNRSQSQKANGRPIAPRILSTYVTAITDLWVVSRLAAVSLTFRNQNSAG